MSKFQPNKNILVMISGSIAAYKTCTIISKLVQEGHEVQVVTTPQALKFIGPSTLEGLSGKAPLFDLFQSNHAMDHIHLARWADVILLCPATANTINKMAQGIGDDLLTNLFLAHDFKKPFIIAPAMNSYMYQHPCTKSSLTRLREMGLIILEPGNGSLACGEVGTGRLMEPESILTILNDIIKNLKTKLLNNTKENDLRKKTSKILITSGGTQEPIDTMRVITNLSTGKTGSLLAEIFWEHGFEVDYLGAQQSIKPGSPCNLFTFTSFNDLNEKLKELLINNTYTAIIHSAAVSDFHVSKIITPSKNIKRSNIKIPSNEKITIELEPNFKILPLLKNYAKKNSPIVIGFKFTSTKDHNARELAVKKLFNDGGVDWVVHNDHNEIDKINGIHPFTLYVGNSIIPISSPLALGEALIEQIKLTPKLKKPVKKLIRKGIKK